MRTFFEYIFIFLIALISFILIFTHQSRGAECKNSFDQLKESLFTAERLLTDRELREEYKTASEKGELSNKQRYYLELAKQINRLKKEDKNE